VINVKSSIRFKLPGVVLGTLALLAANCGGSKKPIVVGSKSTTTQVLIGEIVAQHLENRLGRKIGRALSLGNTPVAYQAFANGEIGLYPEETGTIQALILKETPSSDASMSLERDRNEIRRTSQAEVLDPLGIDDKWAVLVKKNEAAKNNVDTLSDAASVKPGWKLGVTRDFNERLDGLAALTQYRLPMIAIPRVGDPGSLYNAMEAGDLSMVVATATDGEVNRHGDWKTLRDDKKVFPSYQTCLMVKADLLANDPKLQPALAELAGKFTNENMAAMAAQVDFDHKKPAEIAAEFLAKAGLKSK
jgi:osmoprotectant transport system substrate-binding protein